MEVQHRDEKILIKKAITGDKVAFGKLYDQYFVRIFRYLRMRCGNLQDAEDMTEEVFIRAWENLPAFKIHAKPNYFSAWLFRIAHNALIDNFRKPNREESVEKIPEKGRNCNKIEENILHADLERQLLDAILALDNRAQQVIIARFISGLTHKETAYMLDTSPGNVRIIQFRALQRIREYLKRDGYDE